MDPSYVECDEFRVASDIEIGAVGQRLRIRSYVLKASPSTKVSDITNTVLVRWAEAGRPSDALFHLGPFYRVTNITREFMERSNTDE